MKRFFSYKSWFNQIYQEKIIRHTISMTDY
ncbi:hypothetical protein [Chryseobacterium sp. BIGb0232]